jgi:myo-inositol-1(or 4)-monophosphatase
MLIETIIKSTGNILRSEFEFLKSSSMKDKFDLVTSSDIKIEKMLIDYIATHFPDDSIYSEEAGSIGKASNRRWIIDPIDGTSVFVFGVPYFAISIALETENGIEEGYVYNPFSEEFYHSSKKDRCSYLNNKPIRVSRTSSIDESLVAFGFSADKTNIIRYLEEWGNLMASCRKALPLVTPSLTICNVARGRIDAYIDFGSSMEGKAAASLILQNAGGRISGYDSSSFDFREKGHICTNGNIGVEDYRTVK